jgi:alkanesulfonate monooxygenase SsuD/methylene tetrahydromethanopterin reductase-like flavin-dependent oxidoreductase (luciferase family)
VLGGPETAIEELERYEDAVGVDEVLLRMLPGARHR